MYFSPSASFPGRNQQSLSCGTNFINRLSRVASIGGIFRRCTRSMVILNSVEVEELSLSTHFANRADCTNQCPRTTYL